MSPEMLLMIAMIVLMAAITAFIGWMLAYLWRDPEGYVNWVRRYSIANKTFDGALYRRMAWISLPLALILVGALTLFMIFLMITNPS